MSPLRDAKFSFAPGDGGRDRPQKLLSPVKLRRTREAPSTEERKGVTSLLPYMIIVRIQ